MPYPNLHIYVHTLDMEAEDTWALSEEDQEMAIEWTER